MATYCPTKLSEEEARAIWRSVDGVCFDVDSTVCTDEAIDELAEYCGVGEAVAEWTRKAMGGGMSFRRALSERLALIQPSRQDLEDFCRLKPPSLTPGVAQLINELHRRRTKVFLVSGGFTRMIQDVASLLDIPHKNIFANVILFDAEGNYAGFDVHQPTSDSGGKPELRALSVEVVRRLRSRHNLGTVAMVGDGMTDAEAAPPADVFVHFAGNQMRDAVKKVAPWTVSNFNEMLDELLTPRLI